MAKTWLYHIDKTMVLFDSRTIFEESYFLSDVTKVNDGGLASIPAEISLLHVGYFQLFARTQDLL